MIPGLKEIGGKASVASPNGAGGGGGGLAPHETFFGLQRPLDSLKMNSNFLNCGYEARQKS